MQLSLDALSSLHDVIRSTREEHEALTNAMRALELQNQQLNAELAQHNDSIANHDTIVAARMAAIKEKIDAMEKTAVESNKQTLKNQEELVSLKLKVLFILHSLYLIVVIRNNIDEKLSAHQSTFFEFLFVPHFRFRCVFVTSGSYTND